jgi:hypothetical protein
MMQEVLGVGCMMVKVRRATLFGLLAAWTGLAKAIQIFALKMALRFVGVGDF